MRKLSGCAINVLGCLLVLQSTLLSAADAGKPAGVIAYACVADRQLVLLAYDAAWGRHGWASFGGTPSSASEPVHETASREFHEETGCVFAVPAAASLAEAEYSVSGGFYSFVAEVPHVPAIEIEASGCGDKDLRSDWIWIDAGDLRRALDQPGRRIPAPGRDGIQLWDLARQSMAKAVQDGILDLSHRVCE